MSATIAPHDTVAICKYCHSDKIRKERVRYNKSGAVRVMKCTACNKTFSANFGFRYRRHDPAVISEAIHLYYSGMSVRAISDALKVRDIKVSPSAIYKWVRRYSKIASIYTDSLAPSVGNWFRGDEVWVKVNGKKHYLFATMDDDTRYWLAGELADSKDAVGGKNPTVLTTDKLPAYQKAARKILGNKTYHKCDAGIRSKRVGPSGKKNHANFHPSNNKMERLNGTIRDREKTFRGLGTIYTPVFDGMKVHYNHCRVHDSIKKTPAEAAGISVDGTNKCKTIIQNSSLHLLDTNRRVPSYHNS